MVTQVVESEDQRGKQIVGEKIERILTVDSKTTYKRTVGYWLARSLIYTTESRGKVSLE